VPVCKGFPNSQVKKLLALANIHTFKDGDHTQTVDDPTFGDKAQTAEGLHEVEKKKESSNEPISDNDSNATIEYDEMYERPQSPLHSNDIIENETTHTFTLRMIFGLDGFNERSSFCLF
jgi:hypothetical protein